MGRKKILETPFDAISALSSSFIVRLRKKGEKERLWLPAQRTDLITTSFFWFYRCTHIYLSLIRLIYCFVIAICYGIIIIYFVNEHDVFLWFFFKRSVLNIYMRCWVSSLGLIFFHHVSHPFEFRVFFLLFFF